jgi:hypothetical protein
MSTYSSTSPYYNTGFTQYYLDLMINRPIPKESDDLLMKINTVYEYRPDLLAYDLYGDVNFWWVFALRNPNTIQDPVFDMQVGNTIFLPKKDTIVGIIGY